VPAEADVNAKAANATQQRKNRVRDIKPPCGGAKYLAAACKREKRVEHAFRRA